MIIITTKLVRVDLEASTSLQKSGCFLIPITPLKGFKYAVTSPDSAWENNGWNNEKNILNHSSHNYVIYYCHDIKQDKGYFPEWAYVMF